MSDFQESVEINEIRDACKAKKITFREKMFQWPGRSSEFSENVSVREFNVPGYKRDIAAIACAAGTKWDRTYRIQPAVQMLTIDEPTKRPVIFCDSKKLISKNINLPQNNGIKNIPSSTRKCVDGCKRDGIAVEGLLEMIATPADPKNIKFVVIRGEDGAQAVKVDIQRRIGLFIRSLL